jgi:hypothetical protein
MVERIMGTLEFLIDKGVQWVDRILGFFDFYSTRYSKLVLFGFLGLVLAKFFKGKVNLGVNVGKKK